MASTPPTSISARSVRLTSPVLLALATALLMASCYHYSSMKHGSGQLALWGEKSWGKRTGIWVYFDETGAVQRDISSGRTRTGFYENDVKTRELTEAEFQTGLAEARRLASMTGAKMLLADPK